MHFSFITDLGGKEVLEDTEVFNLEFNDEWLLLVEAESGEAGEGRCFVEHVKVSEGELLLNTL